MTRRGVAGAVLSVIALAAGASIGFACSAHASARRPAVTSFCNHPGLGRSHKPYIDYGMTRVRDNAWAGPSSKRFCITTNGRWLRVDTSAVPFGGNVVAYPDLETGPEFTWPDTLSGLPLRVRDLRQTTWHVWSNCSAPGNWLADVDSYFRADPSSTGHATAELVVANCWSGGTPGGKTVVIHGTCYTFRHWITGDTTGLTWPIAVFRQCVQTTHASVMIGRFTYWLRRHHLLPAVARWYASGAYGPEIWSGGKGLLVYDRVTGLPVVPVIRPLGGSGN